MGDDVGGPCLPCMGRLAMALGVAGLAQGTAPTK